MKHKKEEEKEETFEEWQRKMIIGLILLFIGSFLPLLVLYWDVHK